jgi:tRNA-splicing ligase RtcB
MLAVAWLVTRVVAFCEIAGTKGVGHPNQQKDEMREIRMWTKGVPVEQDAMTQLRNIASLPIVAGHVAVMPDVHLGKGATVGSVIPTRQAIIPAAVGVDIGCGMLAVETSLMADDLPDSLSPVRAAIEAAVPVGFSAHQKPVGTFSGGLQGIALYRRTRALHERFATLAIMAWIGRLNQPGKVWNQVGTLGGGNHFIELCLDERNRVWLMLHSGSRNIGKVIGETAIGIAKEHARVKGYALPDRDLAWLDEGTPEFAAYVAGMTWAQDYAALNRDLMLHLILQIMTRTFGDRFKVTGEIINCHHNFSSIEEHFGEKMWITRKGAVQAHSGQMGIIPGSMGARSFIVTGKGNPESYYSCSHGAGRRLSRGAAKRQYSLNDLLHQTTGIECRKDSAVIDEIPAAYKDIDAVMAAQESLVEIRHTLKQVLCIKG